MAKTRKAAADATSALQDFMSQGWAPDLPTADPEHPAVANFASRRRRLSRRFPGQTVVIATGGLKTRSNDDDYRFRPGSDFYWLTGSLEPDGVLILRPTRSGHSATLYVMPRSDQTTSAYFKDSRYGEMWVGPRRGIKETRAHLRIATASLNDLDTDLKALDVATTVVRRGIDTRIDAHTNTAQSAIKFIAIWLQLKIANFFSALFWARKVI